MMMVLLLLMMMMMMKKFVAKVHVPFRLQALRALENCVWEKKKKRSSQDIIIQIWQGKEYKTFSIESEAYSSDSDNYLCALFAV